MMLLIRVALLLLLLYLLFKGFRYILHPKRKLELAIEQKKYHFYDEKDNIRKNFIATLKGVIFEGEKYLGTDHESFTVVSITMNVSNPSALSGFTLQDIRFLETEIYKRYPKARIDWKDPIQRLLEGK
ncbi:sigma-w pathway protein ysdB [Bacillus coahuilensis p1.1.43]|uniref:Sigma-w pathway protein ysdB n=1 Tax=Bacillus coahuilensis p1.1.43 TaxID=1150625 RepID=A0A147K6V6_9BACI|nr:hypothetical protein [Bacillus coahuilensis]KUP05771.1 sigma-w pathway protein ysdB [Bacillus coahuilensis p1.1.43]